MTNPDLKPWQWPEETWRGRVSKVRAGKTLSPAWPEGKSSAVALSFDVDHESTDLRDGAKSISRMSWGQYGNRRGMPRILELLRRHDILASFYVPAVIAQLYPDEQRRVVAKGHEIGIHGWIHELNSILPRENEYDLMARSMQKLEKITGQRPVGMGTPSWDFSDATLSIIRELGLTYDSSLMADDSCYELLEDGKPTGVVEFPVEWIRDDAPYFMMSRFESLRPHIGPEDVLAIFLREFEAALAEGELFQLTMHPHIIGYRSRIWIVEEIIRAAKAKRDVWFAMHRQIAEHAAKVIGAWLQVKVGDKVQEREITSGGGHAGGQLGWHHVGLGSAVEVELRAIWPDGTTSGWASVHSDTFYDVTRDQQPIVH